MQKDGVRVSNVTSTFNGIVHGKTIELDHEPGLPDGQQVTVTVRAQEDEHGAPRGEGLRRAFGGWAEDADELDKFLDWNREQRRRGRRELDQ